MLLIKSETAKSISVATIETVTFPGTAQTKQDNLLLHKVTGLAILCYRTSLRPWPGSSVS